MKKLFLTLFLTVITTAMLQAQQISVVSGGDTNLYQTLQEAIENAPKGSVIYLPGGGFQISDEVKITKKLTIVGIGHKSNNDNVDGVTTISGNLWFNEGSSGSAVLACYITGNVNIGNDGSSVNNMLIRYCNLESVQVHSSICQESVVNQNYVRSMSSFGNSNARIYNNLIHSIWEVDGGNISNNVLFGFGERWINGYCRGYCINVSNSIIVNNIIFPYQGGGGGNWSNSMYSGSNNTINNNMSKKDFGDNPINIGSVSWEDVFVNYNGGAISPLSDFHFKGDFKQYESQVGVYAGDGFNDNQMAPVPYIVAKHIDQQTDAQGKLNVKIRVKAGQ